MAITLQTGRSSFTTWYDENRRRSAALFDIVTPEAYASRPIPLRHPVRFYEGHLPAFSFITLARDAAGKPSIDERMETLFYRGIDPASAAAAEQSAPQQWPDRAHVQELAAKWDAAVLDVLRAADAGGAALSPRIREASYTILEHEPMHHETLLYMLHQVPLEEKHRTFGDATITPGGAPARNERIHIRAGRATLGARRERAEFGWDNEFQETIVDVQPFTVDKHSVTNADYLEFVENGGGQTPPFWRKRDGRWMQLCMFEEVSLPAAWPAYVSHEQASAYARWRGARLMSEAEFHRAAYGTPGGDERAYPWGDAAPSANHGNFGFQHFEPMPIGAYPAGASAWGVEDLVGNGWEWTSTVFAPFAGFERMQSYPGYSADFFDNQHYVMLGASPVTATELIRRSLRNWFRPNYPYVYAKFRLAY
ncbi:MAG: SUMF1/EgtB/PvdO family nonheme iron enzyme [Candidatus Eremiobacteraeota bacterium]|nr:SUMF1/EgtB/PvdO family nonheme iron enzyme [Candidatus Eremiobacteraeota bacterium]MBV8366284.1 SUMF1/EgtB/PvdO family nonheme iron enzyme [Candidatus Eremiobacteraeota bacterium]